VRQEVTVAPKEAAV